MRTQSVFRRLRPASSTTVQGPTARRGERDCVRLRDRVCGQLIKHGCRTNAGCTSGNGLVFSARSRRDVARRGSFAAGDSEPRREGKALRSFRRPRAGALVSRGIRQRHRRQCRGGKCSCPWEASVYSKRDGRKIRKVFPSQTAAVAWREETRVAVRRLQVGAPSHATLSEAAEVWFQGAREGWIRTRSGDKYKPAAIRAYEVGFRIRTAPALGHKRLSQLTRNDVQDLVDDLLAEGCSPSTVVVAVSSIRVIYKRALARGEVVVNPVAGVQMPSVRAIPVRIATPAECARLLSALRVRDRPIWATAMYAGLRRGELMALRLEDVDLERCVITVSRGWDVLEGEISTKSGRVRTVPIATLLREELTRHIDRLQWTEGLAFGYRVDRPFHGTPLFRRAERAWDAAGLERITLHECRHTFASLMIDAGVNAKALSSYMGHANISITMDRYGHLMPGNETQAAAMLDRYLDRAPRGRHSGTRASERSPARNGTGQEREAHRAAASSRAAA